MVACDGWLAVITAKFHGHLDVNMYLRVIAVYCSNCEEHDISIATESFTIFSNLMIIYRLFLRKSLGESFYPRGSCLFLR